MNLQVLVATMNQKDHSLLDKMNIRSDAIIGNQCDQNSLDTFIYKEHKVKWLSLAERGVGLNRNNTLMRANADIVLFADDDVVYNDGYEKMILDFYNHHLDADVVIFNFIMRRGCADFYERVRKEGKVRSNNAFKYGTYCISARLSRIRFANIFFHLEFGGGAKYSSGEDSLFLYDCLRKKLKVYASKVIIGTLDHGESTWFQGYNDKYFYDKGVLFYALNCKMCKLIALYNCYKHRKDYYKAYGWKNAYKQMFKGIKGVSKNIRR